MNYFKCRFWDTKKNVMYPAGTINLFTDSMGDVVCYYDGKLKAVPNMRILQYTGLKDKNGKEIYEGDIFEYGYIVTWLDGSDLANLGMDVGFYSQRDDFESWAMLEVGAEYEVIGNVFENPEQLK
jgi:hypothetical protein